MTQLTDTRRKPFWTPRQLATRWKCGRLTVIRAIKTGKLHAVRFGNRGHYRIPVVEIERVERGEVAQ